MKVKLVRYSFPDKPEWEIIRDTVPLGTIYEVLAHHSGIVVMNEEFGTREIDCYEVEGNGSTGLLPTCVFEIVE